MFNHYGPTPPSAAYNSTPQQNYPLAYEKQESNYHQYQQMPYGNYSPPQQGQGQYTLHGSPPSLIQPYNDNNTQTAYGQDNYGQHGPNNQYQNAHYGTSIAGLHGLIPTHAQQQPIIFNFSSTDQANPSLNLSATDSWGRILFSVSTPSKNISIATDAEGRVIATFEWDHSSPKMDYRGQAVKTKDFLRFEKKPTSHYVLRHDGRPFGWNGVLSGQSILCHESIPGRPVAILSRPEGHIQLQMFQEALSQGMLEPVLLSVFLLTCGKPFGSSGRLGSATLSDIAFMIS